jgi:hypothetical protein
VAMKVNGKQDPDGIRLYRILILSKWDEKTLVCFEGGVIWPHLYLKILWLLLVEECEWMNAGRPGQKTNGEGLE